MNHEQGVNFERGGGYGSDLKSNFLETLRHLESFINRLKFSFYQLYKPWSLLRHLIVRTNARINLGISVSPGQLDIFDFVCVT